MKLVEACLSARNDGESCFHHCGGPVKLVEIEKEVFNTLEQESSRRTV